MHPLCKPRRYNTQHANHCAAGTSETTRILDRLEEMREARKRKPKPITLPKLRCLED